MNSANLHQPPSASSGRRTRSYRSASLAIGLATVGCGFALGCGGDETYTPDACQPQRTYDIRELYAEENAGDPDIAQLRANVEAQVKAAAEKGCVTAPKNTPPLKDSPSGRRALDGTLSDDDTLADDTLGDDTLSDGEVTE